MKKSLIACFAAITVICAPAAHASVLTMPSKVATKVPSFAIAVGAMSVGALAATPLENFIVWAMHDPDGTKEYLADKPIRRNALRMKTFSALRHAKSYQDYKYLHDGATDYLGFTGLPPYEGTDVDTDIPGYGITEVDNAPIINPIRDARPGDIVLINPITKTKINVTMEYPTEDIRTWKDYLIVKQDSIKLSHNMKKKGQIRPKDVAAHHIIPVNAAGADDARNIWINECKKDINDAENGVFLPTKVNHPIFGNAIVHNGPHGNIHSDMINNVILEAYKKNKCPGVFNEINKIKNKLLNGKGKNWSNVL